MSWKFVLCGCLLKNLSTKLGASSGAIISLIVLELYIESHLYPHLSPSWLGFPFFMFHLPLRSASTSPPTQTTITSLS